MTLKISLRGRSLPWDSRRAGLCHYRLKVSKEQLCARDRQTFLRETSRPVGLEAQNLANVFRPRIPKRFREDGGHVIDGADLSTM